MSRRRILRPSDEACPDPGFTDLAPAALDDSLRQVRHVDRRLPLDSLAAFVASRLLAALELGIADLDSGHRPDGHQAGVPKVAKFGPAGVILAWVCGTRTVKAAVNERGEVLWALQVQGHAAFTHGYPAGHPGAYDAGRGAMAWLLGRPEEDWTR